MIEATPFAGNDVAVLGLGRSGLSAARALKAGGARVLAWDDDRKARGGAAGPGVALKDLREADWTGMAALILSPGIPHTYPEPHPAAVMARNGGVEIIGDTEILVRCQPSAVYFGITGTNGKSTTTALVAHILAAAGRRHQVGGNLGVPALDLEPMGADGAYVLEMSSYQLELTPSLSCDVAVLLNITPDHLDRHGGWDGYVAAKKLIFVGQPGTATAVVGVDDDAARAVYEELKAKGGRRVVPVSGGDSAPGGIACPGGVLTDDMEDAAAPVLDLKTVAALPGAHNRQNAAAAYAVVRTAGIGASQIAEAIQSYPGLPHRQEVVAVIDGVAYVNDSKATNWEAAAKALGCYENICWIAGGQAKDTEPMTLDGRLGSVVHAFLIGQAADMFAGALSAHIPVTKAGTLEAAVEGARDRALEAAARAGASVVLLSPACASFDQFRNFEARGEAFREIVAGLAGTRETRGPAATGEGGP